MIQTKSYHYYGKYYKEPSGLKRLDFMADNIKRKIMEKGGVISVLEVGCGNGNICIAMGSLGNLDVIGLDIDEMSIKQAIIQNSFSNVKFVCGRIEKQNFYKRFDVIILSEVLEHLTEPEQMLVECKKILESDGILLITIPSGYGIFEIAQRYYYPMRKKIYFLIRKLGYKIFSKTIVCKFLKILKKKIINNKMNIENIQSSNIGEENRHIQYFTLGNFKELLRRQEIEIVSIKNSNCNGGFGVLWYLFFQRQIKRGTKPFHFFDRIDCLVAEIIPHFMAAGWYFACRLRSQD